MQSHPVFSRLAVLHRSRLCNNSPMQDTPSIRWHRWTTPAALALAWLVLALWQYQEYRAECDAARETSRRQAESVMNALVGGIQSHRRLGRFMEDQLQGALDELATSQDILAVEVASADRSIVLKAGHTDLLDQLGPLEPGSHWNDAGYCYVTAFQLAAEPPNTGGMGMGMGPGRGGGWGRGGGRAMPPMDQGPLAAGSRFLAAIILDRTATDRQIEHYAWLRIFVTVAGGLVIVSIGLAWRSAIRLADARSRARLLEIEARNLRDLGQAAAGLAHETRNPLGLIRGWTQRWMQTLGDNPTQREQAVTVIEECDRVTARINQFLAFARPCEPKSTPVDPAEVVDELAVLLEPDLNAKQLTVDQKIPKNSATIRADREMFRQALFNLLQNAIEFSPTGGTVEIGIDSRQDGIMRMTLADRGPGVPAEEVDLLFTPYHTTRSAGTGLGLAIVRRIASAHGWTAGYTPRPGGGSIFWLDGIHG